MISAGRSFRFQKHARAARCAASTIQATHERLHARDRGRAAARVGNGRKGMDQTARAKELLARLRVLFVPPRRARPRLRAA